jgi:hypothetical protein
MLKYNNYMNNEDRIPLNEGDKSQDIRDFDIITILYLYSYAKFYNESATKKKKKSIKGAQGIKQKGLWLILLFHSKYHTNLSIRVSLFIPEAGEFGDAFSILQVDHRQSSLMSHSTLLGLIIHM